MKGADRLEARWAIGSDIEHHCCKVCNEPRRGCECERRRPARFFEELDMLAAMYRAAIGGLMLRRDRYESREEI